MQRLINLGFASTLPEGDEATDDHRQALVGYRTCAGKPVGEDDAIASHMLALHEGGSTPEDGSPGASV